MNYYFFWCMPDHAKLRDIQSGDFGNGLEGSDTDNGSLINKRVNAPALIRLRSGEGDMPEMFMHPFVVREDLLKAFESCGVDNLQVFDAIVYDEKTSDRWTNYKLINIVGIVDIIDMEASTRHPDSPPEIAVLFDEIVFDSKKALGCDLLRPMHMITDIVVSEKLKNFLEKNGSFPNLEFIEPEEYA